MNSNDNPDPSILHSAAKLADEIRRHAPSTTITNSGIQEGLCAFLSVGLALYPARVVALRAASVHVSSLIDLILSTAHAASAISAGLYMFSLSGVRYSLQELAGDANVQNKICPMPVIAKLQSDIKPTYASYDPREWTMQSLRLALEACQKQQKQQHPPATDVDTTTFEVL
jgi:hypothetical protein